MVRIINSRIEGLAQGVSATDGVNISQLEQQIVDTVKRQSYWHGTVITSNLVTVANGSYAIDTLDASPAYFFPITLTVRQTSVGVLSLGAATISIGTNSPTYNNLITLTSTHLASIVNGSMINVPLGSVALAPLAASGAIFALVTGVAIGTSITLAIDINGVYRATL